MKKADLKVGRAYAVGGSASYDRDWWQRAVVVELAGERVCLGHWGGEGKLKGIVIRFAEGTSLSSATVPQGHVVKDAPEMVLSAATGIHCEWEPYAEQRKREKAAAYARAVERERRAVILQGSKDRLEAYGFELGRYDSGVRFAWGDQLTATFTAEGLAKLLAMVEPADVCGVLLARIAGARDEDEHYELRDQAIEELRNGLREPEPVEVQGPDDDPVF